MSNLIPGHNCTEPSINEFPEDLFTFDQLKSGYVAVHFIVCIYTFYALAIVCDDYFVPSVERIAKEFNIPSEIAGCTIMGIANSSPELFTNVIGTFITQGDLGIGMILGASVFNILAVGACIGLATTKAVYIQWWPLTRDSLFYIITVAALFRILVDHQVQWYDAIILIVLYALYILIICFNSTLRRWAKKILGCWKYGVSSRSYSVKNEFTGKKNEQMSVSSSTNTLAISVDSSATTDDELDIERIPPTPEPSDDALTLFKLPREAKWTVWADWVIGWPIRLVLTITIPDCNSPSWRRWYPVTFVMCIAWNTALCYLVSWMVTVIGYTFGIPDTVMGLTVIAAGTSVPQAVSSVIVARKGLGTMAMNNAIGSNIFNILVCLGIPWLIQILINIKNEEPYIQIYSLALEYSTLMLIAAMLFLYFIVAANNFHIDKKVGAFALLVYVIFLTIGSLFELNVFFDVNLPTCS